MIDSISKPGDLSQVPADGVIFELAGKQYTVRADAIGEAKNHTEFMAALTAELAKEPALAGLQATLSGNEVTLVDPAGGTFKQGGWTFKNNIVPSSGDIKWAQSVGKATDVTEPVSTTLVLDKVGHSTSQGGSVNIGSAGAGGIEVFDLKVGGSSWVRKIESKAEVEHSLKGDQHLAEVKISHLEDGAKGGLKVGEKSTNTDGRVQANGFTDVREVNAEGFTGNLNLGIELTDKAVARYLGPDVKEPVEFAYVGGEGADLFNIAIDGAVTADPDFRGKIDLGAGDDRLVLKADKLDQIKIDGGEGRNTIVVEGTGMGAGSLKPNEFNNFQVYEIGGDVSSVHTFTSLKSVEQVIVATKPDANTSIPPDVQLKDFNGDALLITGKEQTSKDGNADQKFGAIELLGANEAAVTVTLDNTARKDGSLEVGSLGFGNNGADLSQVRDLTIESKGQREVSNKVGEIEANGVGNFTVKGTQAFTTKITAAANTASSNPADFTNLVVNASGLAVEEGKPGFDLTLNAGVVTKVDTGSSSAAVTLTGTAGKDKLTLTDGALQLTDDTTVLGFETIQFGDTAATAGKFNASKVIGATDFIIANTSAALELTHLGNAINVEMDTEHVTNNVTIRGAGAKEAVNIKFLDTGAVATGWEAAGKTLFVGGYENIKLDLTAKQVAGEVNTYNFDLELLDREGKKDGDADFVETGAADWVGKGIAARTLEVVGGDAKNHDDSLTLDALDVALDVIDFSGYNGAVTGALKAHAAKPATDVQINVGSHKMVWDTGNDNTSTFNVTFKFVKPHADAGLGATVANAGVVWEISNFIGGTAGALGTLTGNNQNYGKLDLSGLGIQDRDDVLLMTDGTDTWLYSQAEHASGLASKYSWAIKLVGADYTVADGLVADNFIFG